MSSVQSFAHRLLLPAVLLISLATSGLARAESLKPADVEENRQSCLAACAQAGAESTKCQSYCDCSVKGMSEQITLEEYNAGKVALANNKQPPQEVIDKLTAVAKSCKSQLQ